MQQELQIYVDATCTVCTEARRLASFVMQELPHLQVAVIDVSQDDARIPRQVFAVPTYVLNGTTLWLGNPDELELLQRLKSAIRQT